LNMVDFAQCYEIRTVTCFAVKLATKTLGDMLCFALARL
jgi:hypothetical protein